jgi:predicted component of type VI protein secretion system
VIHADGDSFIVDLSASGTFIDGTRVPKDKPTKLSDGQQVSFGESRATYTFRGAPSKEGKRKRGA